jgi:hypothetical protein
MAGSLASINIKFSADLKQFSTQMQTATRDIAKLGDSFASVGQGLTVGLTTPILGLGGLAVKTAADFETLRTSLLSSFQGNQAAADSAFKTIEKFATTSPYQVEEVLNAFIKLKNLGLDPSEEALTSYGNTASAMGKDLNQMIEAVADASTGEFERLKEFGIKAKSEGDKVSFTFQGVTTTIGKNSEEIQKYLMDIGNVNFQGSMDRQSETFKGRLSSLQDTFASFGDSIGTIILEFMSPMIDSLQELAEYFKKLSPETQKTIVVIAGLAAAIGPLLLAIGGLMQLVPVMVAGFAAIKGAFASLTASMSANPITALAVALGLVIAGIYAYTQATNGAVSATKLYADVREVAAKSVAKEKAELDTLLKIAKDETLSKQQRQTAIDKLNKISPEYLGNLRLETINTNEAKKAIDAYNVALNQRALQQAVLSKKTELFNELIELQNKDLNLTGNAFSDAAQKASNYIFSLLGVETQTIKNRAELEQYIKSSKLEGEAAKAVRSSYEVLIREREKDVKNIQSQIDALDKFNVTEGNAVVATDALTTSTTALNKEREKLPMAGTIAFYENEISKLQKLQKEQIKTGYEYLVLQSKIDEFQKKIDEIAVKPIEAINLPSLNLPKIDNTERLASIAKAGQENLAAQQAANESWLAEQNRMLEYGQQFNESLASIMESTAENFAIGFGEMIGQSINGGLSIQSIWSLMIGTLADMAIQVGKVAIGIGISVESIKKSLTGFIGVPAIVAGVALIALGTLAKSALANIGGGSNAPAFANGGVVPGTSLYGDKILARVNSGELILNQKQQSNLWGMMNSAGQGVNVNLEGGFRLAGSDLELVIERAINKNSRKR